MNLKIRINKTNGEITGWSGSNRDMPPRNDNEKTITIQTDKMPSGGIEEYTLNGLVLTRSYPAPIKLSDFDRYNQAGSDTERLDIIAEKLGLKG